MLSLRLQHRLDGFTLDLALDAPEEKIIVLFGPSGSGKSLTLGAMAGWYAPDAGRIAVGERVLFDSRTGVNVSPQGRRVGMVRQDLALFPHLSVEENIGYGLFRQTRAARQAIVKQFMSLMRLDEMGTRKPAELSGGQQQRVALARALAIQPSVLLLDEPFSALDLPIRAGLRQEVQALQHELKTSTLFVTHDLGEAHLMADYLAVIEGGHILQFGRPQEIEHAPATARVAEIMGVRNILPASIIAPGCVRVGERELETETQGWSTGSHPRVCLRQERITLVRRDVDPLKMPNVIEGDLLCDLSDGNNVLLWFRSSGARLLPKQDFDLVIDLPQYVYERMNLEHERHWFVSLKPGVIHLVPQ